jgi:AmmeMemoRadiSam system protein A
MSLAEIIDPHDAEILLNLAVESIKQGLQTGRALNIDLDEIPDSLCQPGASFVTLKLDGQLRGCIGHLEASQELVLDVIDNAALAAFRDPRFAPLTVSEFKMLEISLSILSTPEALVFSSEEGLLRKIRPGIDGLILRQGEHQGTFLPSVWESLPEPEGFLRHLKQKAGLPEDYWSDSLQVLRYTAQQIKPSTAGGAD